PLGGTRRAEPGRRMKRWDREVCGRPGSLAEEGGVMRSSVTIWPGMRRAVISAVSGGLLLMLATTAPVHAQSEDTLKSQFILNFAKFTTWPSAAFSSPSSPIVVAFVAAPELTDVFEKLATRE